MYGCWMGLLRTYVLQRKTIFYVLCLLDGVYSNVPMTTDNMLDIPYGQSVCVLGWRKKKTQVKKPDMLQADHVNPCVVVMQTSLFHMRVVNWFLNGSLLSRARQKTPEAKQFPR